MCLKSAAVYGWFVRSKAARAMASSSGVRSVAVLTAALDLVAFAPAPGKNWPATDNTWFSAVTAAVTSELKTSFPSMRWTMLTVLRFPILKLDSERERPFLVARFVADLGSGSLLGRLTETTSI